MIVRSNVITYLGNLVELAGSTELYETPLHPYTQALLSAIPVVERSRKRIILEGDIPNPINPPVGCPFRTRCHVAIDKCEQKPNWFEAKPNHWVACHIVEGNYKK
ncbi:hypothetical protein CSE16_16395 [Solibacillus sp. R5-41]|uniref:oligopeptide/dipeptide ABC transporter ATP-binding protein n=1 Tax=Solibacillus sp. R5-41 TaxID=2048654 RepID=UPI000C12799E|nr:hypothetical protein CSE16_16395 [Solibacillus sp. R5-41]